MNEPIQIVHIAPTSLMLEVDARFNKGTNMLLAHEVLSNEAYRETAKKLTGEKILDNGFFELHKSLSLDEIAVAAQEIGATIVVMPDGEDNGIDRFKDLGIKVMTVPKTKDQLFCNLMNSDIDYVGLSEEHFAYRHHPSIRYSIMVDLVKSGILLPLKKIHLLGSTNNMWEIGMLSPFSPFIKSWDTSAAIWHGYLGKKLNTVIQKDTTPVRFEENIEFNSTMRYNIEFLNTLAKGVL